MVLDSKIAAIRERFGINDPEDWTAIEPGQILAIDGIGPVTLEHVRLYLAGRNLTLKDDHTPDYWKSRLADVRIGGQLGSRDRAVVSEFVIAVDTREQEPWMFEGMKQGGRAGRPLLVPRQSRTLKQGDYSIVGLEQRIAIERKSKTDLYSTLAAAPERFDDELHRLADLEFAAVVVEADIPDLIANPPERTSYTPESLRGRVLAFAVRIPRVQWFFLPGRMFAERWAFALLDRFWRDYQEAAGIEKDLENGLARCRAADPLFA